MENLLFLLATSIVLRNTYPRRFKNYFIGNTGCSALMFSGKRKFDYTETETGDEIYFNEFNDKNITYGIICIRLQDEFELEDSAAMLRAYVNKLKGPFFILHSTGLQKEADWNSAITYSAIDYWQDGDGQDWKVKGYTDGRFMSILYVKNISEVDVARQDLFLDSFHFEAATPELPA